MYEFEQELCDKLGLKLIEGYVQADHGFPRPSGGGGWQVICHASTLTGYIKKLVRSDSIKKSMELYSRDISDEI